MKLSQTLYDLFLHKAEAVSVETISLGLGYTAVTLSDGGIGLSYTYYTDKTSCMALNTPFDYEGGPAVKLLEQIKSDRPIERSMALATINALNYEFALTLPQDKDNSKMFAEFKIGEGTKVAM
ncbi:MAG: enolase N-terminal-like fold-containing protein [bacterium]